MTRKTVEHRGLATKFLIRASSCGSSFAGIRGLELCRKCVLSFQTQRSHPQAASRPAPNPFSLPSRGAVLQGSEGDLTYPCPNVGAIGLVRVHDPATMSVTAILRQLWQSRADCAEAKSESGQWDRLLRSRSLRPKSSQVHKLETSGTRRDESGWKSYTSSQTILPSRPQRITPACWPSG